MYVHLENGRRGVFGNKNENLTNQLKAVCIQLLLRSERSMECFHTILNLIWNSLLQTAITQLVQNVNKYQSP